MSFVLKGLREKRGEIKAEIEKISQKCHAEERAMNTEERAAFEKLKESWVSVGESISTAEADLKALSDLVLGGDGDPAADGMQQNSSKIPGKENRSGQHREEKQSAERDREDRAYAFQAWARHQHGLDLTERHVIACQRTGLSPRSRDWVFRLDRQPKRQTRAQSLTGSAGGYTVAQDFSNTFESALQDYSNVRGVVDEFRTDTGADMPYPTEDDTGNTGELLAEGAEVAYADDTFSAVTFYAFKYSSKGILISYELLNDSAFDLEPLIGQQAGTRIGRAQGAHFTTGTGTSQPKGIVTSATAGITTASATAFTGSELTRLAYSVDPAYRTGPKVGYMMKDDVIAYCLTLLDSTGRPLLRESFRDGGRELMLNGFPVRPNQFMAGLSSNAPVSATKHVLFGDMSKMKIRDVGEVRLKRLDERYAEKDQVGFIAFLRSDQRCVNTSAIKYMLQA